MDIPEQIEAIEEEIRKTPHHKGTNTFIGLMRAKIARLKDREMEAGGQKGGGGGGYAVKRQGDATVVLIGPPSAGKSTLINKLTNAQSKVAPYAFTTVSVVPGMMQYRNAYIQIFDVPGLIEGAQKGKGRGREVLSVARGANLLVFITDPKRLTFFEKLGKELEDAGIRLNKKPPEVKIETRLSGGINVFSNINQELDKETVRDVAGEFGIKNADITIREKLTMDTLIDAFSKNRVYVRAIYVVNKIDEMKDKSKIGGYIPISAQKGVGMKELKERMWSELGFVTVYLVKLGDDPDFSNPIIQKEGLTLMDLAQKIGSEFASLKYGAKIWGNGSKFPGQEVSLSTVAQDGMMVRFI